jgi:hypothetical protein
MSHLVTLPPQDVIRILIPCGLFNYVSECNVLLTVHRDISLQ